jgi:DNA-binding transcriptional MerR regulator
MGQPAHIEWLELMTRLRESGMSIRQMQAYARQVRQGKATLAARQALRDFHASSFRRGQRLGDFERTRSQAWHACGP